MDSREELAKSIEDPELIRYFYLDTPTRELLPRLESISLTLSESQDIVPFNAQVKGYYGAVDNEGDPWILKPAPDPMEALYHRISTLSFFLDHWMGTLSAPTSTFFIGGKCYRATKVVKSAMQISSYNYLEFPFIDILRTDLVNRWLYFDEDRNPNNYLVIHNKKNQPFIVAIDFDKSDFDSTSMKITGTPEKFGWIRTEKTRFLTLLRPENFQGISIEAFENRLSSMMAISEGELKSTILSLLRGYCGDCTVHADTITENILKRRAYINTYFRSSFKIESETKNISNSDDYSMFGESFLAMHKRK